MKKQLLEYIVRECVREVLEANDPNDPTKGAPAPPEGDTGADQPRKDTPPAPPAEKETPPTPELVSATRPKSGIYFIDVNDRSKLIPIKIPKVDDMLIGKTISNVTTQKTGQPIPLSILANNEIKNAIRNPNMALFLYVGKEKQVMSNSNYDTAVNLMASKEEIQTQDGQFQPTMPVTSSPIPQTNPQTNPQAAQLNESLKRMIKKIIRESLRR